MQVKPINGIKFGIYKNTVTTSYGHKDTGIYKDRIITVHHDYKDGTKMTYVADKYNKWIKSKLVYFQNGIKKIIWSKAK